LLPSLHDLGTCEVKHGMRIAIANKQFTILSPGEKCQSKKGMVEILSFPF